MEVASIFGGYFNIIGDVIEFQKNGFDAMRANFIRTCG